MSNQELPPTVALKGGEAATVQPKKPGKNKKFLIAGLILLIPIAFLSYMGFKSALTYYYNVDEFLTKTSTLQDKTVQVGGQVMAGAKSDVDTFELTFTLVDIEKQDNTLPVVYKGAVPDTFKEGIDVIVEGKYTSSDGVFHAKTIITKCASKYIPASATATTQAGN